MKILCWIKIYNCPAHQASGDTLLVLMVITGNQGNGCVVTPVKEGHNEKVPVTESIIIMIIKTLALASIIQRFKSG